ncbi:hypothetical protein THIOSC13_570012 [uncultured Thiomicrorhabdus sp.]
MKQQLIFGLHAVERFLKQAPQSVFSIQFIKGKLNAVSRVCLIKHVP